MKTTIVVLLSIITIAVSILVYDITIQPKIETYNANKIEAIINTKKEAQKNVKTQWVSVEHVLQRKNDLMKTDNKDTNSLERIENRIIIEVRKYNCTVKEYNKLFVKQIKYFSYDSSKI